MRALVLGALLLAAGCAPWRGGSMPPTTPPPAGEAPGRVGAPAPATLGPLANEKRLRNLRQLTQSAENAEAYWSFDGKKLSLQSTRDGAKCDRIWRIDDVLGTPSLKQVSSGEGRTTCAYFLPGDERVIYGSTHEAGKDCPPAPDHSRGYVWPLYASYDIFVANADGSGVKPFIAGPGYDAEATVCRDGSVIFTSTRDGDIDLYVADASGKNVKRLTSEPGYDGGAFFSSDCSQIVWRASRPQGAALEDYRKLLAEGLVRPSKLELSVMNRDGSNVRQVTKLGAAAFAPSFLPDGKRIIFASNHLDPKGRNFDLFVIALDGTGLERVTEYEGFDGFPLFSPDGKHLAFSSNRNGTTPGETNVFVAEWVE